jgi:hypothetical protein
MARARCASSIAAAGTPASASDASNDWADDAACRDLPREGLAGEVSRVLVGAAQQALRRDAGILQIYIVVVRGDGRRQRAEKQ